MKISIITLQNVKNYGSVLQAYATQRKFEQLGFDAEILDFWRNDLLNKNVLSKQAYDSKKWSRNFLTRFVFKLIRTPSLKKQISTFEGFVKKYINLSKTRYLSSDDIKNNYPQADIYCTGSDQTWNSDSVCNDGIIKEYFLDYAPAGKKRISYAASFGKSQLNNFEKEETKELLKKYDAISVREASGLEILKDLGITNGVHIFDPTLVLSVNDWKEMIAPRMIKQKYVLVYQLNKNREFEKYANNFAKQKNMRLVRISNYYDYILKPGKLYCCPMAEKFLSLFYYADFVLTDSFHGTAFSINFNKKFAVVYPESFSTRLQSILELTELTDHVITDYKDYTVTDRFINYNRVNRILDNERRKTDDFLEMALTGIVNIKKAVGEVR